MNIRLIKNKILGRIGGYVSVIETVVLHQLLYPQIAECNDKFIFKIFSQPVYHMELL